MRSQNKEPDAKAFGDFVFEFITLAKMHVASRLLEERTRGGGSMSLIGIPTRIPRFRTSEPVPCWGYIELPNERRGVLVTAKSEAHASARRARQLELVTEEEKAIIDLEIEKSALPNDPMGVRSSDLFEALVVNMNSGKPFIDLGPIASGRVLTWFSSVKEAVEQFELVRQVLFGGEEENRRRRLPQNGMQLMSRLIWNDAFKQRIYTVLALPMGSREGDPTSLREFDLANEPNPPAYMRRGEPFYRSVPSRRRP